MSNPRYKLFRLLIPLIIFLLGCPRRTATARPRPTDWHHSVRQNILHGAG